jgi:signal peptidase I
VSRRRDRIGLSAVIEPVLESLVVGTFLVTFVVQPFRIPSSSMTPTLQVGDCLLMDKQSFAPQSSLAHWLLPPSTIHRGDLAVFHFPIDPSLHLVKRIIGLPGDHVRLHAGRAVVNGTPLAEPYAFHSAAEPNGFRDDFPKPLQSYASLAPQWRTQLRSMMPEGEITVPPGHYFVLGDNRNDSEDSRFWGFVPQSALVGQPLLVYYSVQNRPTWLQQIRAGLHSLRIVR